jgi:hypothetical protein
MSNEQGNSARTPAGSQLQRLKNEHHLMVDLSLAGLDRSQIAEKTGYTPEGVGRILSSPLFQAEVARKRAIQDKKVVGENVSFVTKAREKMESLAVKAVEVHETVMVSAEATFADKQRSADSILKQIFGQGGNQGGTAVSQVVVLEPGAIQLLQVAMQESSD